MHQTLQLTLAPEIALDDENFRQHIIKKLRLRTTDTPIIRKTRQSIDARSRQVKVNVQAEVYVNETPPSLIGFQQDYPDVSKKPQALIIGCGPAGMFAALRLIELGIKPVIFERGKDVRARRRDLAAINKDHIVNPESNYCFGEGGAGTYSDGKLYTRSNKRGDIRRVLEIFVGHGASEQILIDTHPHIGTNKLPVVVSEMRESILKAGGEIHFDTKVTDFIMDQNVLKGVITDANKEHLGIGVILATGHSARDIYELLDAKKILIESKSFAMGVRIEHPQNTIDKIQYHCENDRGPYLPAASYSLVTQTRYKGVQRGVFSFCMCPGGFIVPAATASGEVVVNGMSPSRRDSPYANSGIVVSIEEHDLLPYKEFGALAGLQYQKEIEQAACQFAGATQTAPAQLALDFVKGKVSSQLRETSYQPGLQSVDLREVLPAEIAFPLSEALSDFGQKMRGYLSSDAQLIGVESRTSSPVRIPREIETCEHPELKGLFPCGEGAGYAGGIMSAAMDGERCAAQLAKLYANKKIQ
ncbi:NAD(P)/FAD-dependent oxidoreductase [Dyadobacter fanqingshengii]|uniref:FAD-binding protein n=1 Tax=Dyadobacter fanqingshengii TaxID=2906443 RepID=A0A9X1TBP9_9BACT|nr:FAD-binding protein [Dyadobacter fanqingshengii]MCF0042798.1 FAD-binding protein [Dyadobacter fanqingshengii]USJ35982.1 FAD-binding protein [Dyadobacter fanqingshengii]